jgi:hypothetical protein
MIDKTALEELIMDAIANDYEDLEMIRHEVKKWSAPDANPPSITDIVEGLVALIDKGLARAYRLSPHTEVVEDFRNAPCLDELYFYISPRGKAALSDETTN